MIFHHANRETLVHRTHFLLQNEYLVILRNGGRRPIINGRRRKKISPFKVFTYFNLWLISSESKDILTKVMHQELVLFNSWDVSAMGL